MARYIDADKFTERIKVSPAFCNINDGLLLQRVVIDLLNNAPTADVVPKSEVAKEFTCFVGDPHKVERCPYLDEIEKAKTEVASEIFAEIENNLSQITRQSSVTRMIAELKKKYTEGE